MAEAPLYRLDARRHAFNRFHGETLLYQRGGQECVVFKDPVATDLLHLLFLEACSIEETIRRLEIIEAPRRIAPAAVEQAMAQLLEQGFVEACNRPWRNSAILPDEPVTSHIARTTADSYFYTPYAATMFINGRCNQKCNFCFLDFDHMERLHESLDVRQWLEIVDCLVEAGVFFINIGGMEPFVSFDLTVAILERARASGCIFGLTTNGSISLSDAQLEQLVRLRPTIGVSLESHIEAVHDTAVSLPRAFSRVVKNLRRWLDAGLSIEIQTVGLRSGSERIEDFLQWLDDDLGITQFHLQNVFAGPWCRSAPFFDIGMRPAEYRSLMDRVSAKARDVRYDVSWDAFPHETMSPTVSTARAHALEHFSLCSAGKTSIYVAPNGDLSPCPVKVGHSEHVVGNMLETPFLELWHRTPAFGDFRVTRREGHRSGVCRSCEAFDHCRGGCLVTAEAVLGDILGGDPRCRKVYESNPSLEERGRPRLSLPVV